MHAGIDLVLVDKIVNEVKSQGVFDQFRKDSMADVDTKPAYQNLRQRVESTVSKFLSDQKWKSDLNKFQLREKLRKHIVDAGFLDTGVERIVDQVVNPKISAVFQPKIEDIAYKFLGIEKPHTSPKNYGLNGSLDIKTDLLPTDLEAVSPDSDKTKSESKEDIFNESIEERNEEYESPAFEPLDAVAAVASSPIKKEESDHSQLSGISGLTSQDSISSGNKANSPPQKFTNNNDTQPESDLSEVSSNSRLSIVTNEENSSASKPIVNKVADVDMSEEAQMPKFSENSEDIKVEHDLHFDIKREDIKFEGTERKGDSDLFNFGHHHDGGIKSETELSNSTPEKNSISPSKPEEISAKDEKSSEIKVEEQDTFSTKNSLFIDERNECTQAIDMSMSENESSQETNNSDSMPKKKQSSNTQSNENMGAMFRPRPPSPPNDYMLQKPPSPNYYMKPFPPPPPTPPPPPPPGDSYVQPPLPPPPESSLPPIPPTPPSLPPLPPIPANPPPPGEEPPLPELPPRKEREAPRPPSPPLPREESSFHLKPNPPEYRTDEQHLLTSRSMAEEKSPRSPDDFDYNEIKFQRETPIKYSTRSTPPRYPPSPPLRGFADAEGYYQDRYERNTYREKEKEKGDSYNMSSTRETKEEYKPQSSISDRSSLREIGREKDNSNSSLYSPTSAPHDQYSPDDKHNMEIKREKDTLRSPPSPEQRGGRNKYGKESPRYSANKPSWSPRSPKYRPPSPPNIKSPATPEPYSPYERWDRRPPSPKAKPHTPSSPKTKPHTPPSPKAKPHTPPSPKAKPHTPPDPYTNMEDQGTPVNDEYIHSPSPPPYEELRPNSPNSIDLKSISSKETSFSHSENSQNESTSKPPSPFSPTQKASSKEYETVQRHSTSHSKSTCDSKSDVDILKPPSTTSHSKSSSRSSSHHSHHHKSSKSSKDDRSSTKSSSHKSSSSSSRHHTSSSSHRSSEDKKHSSSSSSSNRHKSSKSDSKQRDRDRDREREKDRDRKKDDHSSARHKERRRKSTDSNDGNNRRHGSKHGSSSGGSSRHGQERSGHGTTNKESGTHSNSSGNLSSNSNSCNNSSRHHTTSRSNNKNKERSSKSHKEDALELFIITEEEKQTTETKIAQLDNAIKTRKSPVYLMDCEKDYQEAFKTLCENVISISGKSNDNNSITLEANQTDVEDISMKSSIDLTITNGVARKRKALNPYRTPYKSLTAANEKLREAHCLLIDCCDYDKHSKLPRLDESRADVSPTSSDMSVSSKENEFMGGKNKKAKLQTPKNGGFIKAQGIVRIEKSGGVGNGFKVNNQRYSSEDLYKPRPLIPRPRRRELLDDQNLV